MALVPLYIALYGVYSAVYHDTAYFLYSILYGTPRVSRVHGPDSLFRLLNSVSGIKRTTVNPIPFIPLIQKSITRG